MRKPRCVVAACVFAVLSAWPSPAAELASRDGSQTLDVLFIGNSYTRRHDLPKLVKAMAEQGAPSLRFDVSTVIYGGRRLVDHWRLGTQNFVKIAASVDN